MTLWRRHIQGLTNDPTRPILPWLAPRAFKPWPEYAGRRESSTLDRQYGAVYYTATGGESKEPPPTRPCHRPSGLKSAGLPASVAAEDRADSGSARTRVLRKGRTQKPFTRRPRIFKVYNDYDKPSDGIAPGLELDPRHSSSARRARADEWYEAILGLSQPLGDAQSHTQHETRRREQRKRQEIANTNGGKPGKASKKRKFVQINLQRQEKLGFLKHVGNRNSSIGRAYMKALREKEELAATLLTQRQRQQRGTLMMVSLGRLVLTYGKRHSRQGGDFLYLVGDYSRKWFRWMAFLRQQYTSEPQPRAIIPDALDPLASEWAHSVLNGGELPRDTDEHLHGLAGCRYRIWMETMLWILQNEPENALKFLVETHLKPLPPVYMHAQVMELLITRATVESASVEQNTLVKIAQTIAHIARRASLNPFDMDGYYLTLLLKACNEHTIQSVMDYLDANFRIPLQTRLLAIRKLGENPDTLEFAIAQIGKLGPIPVYYHGWARKLCFSILRNAVGRKNGSELCIQAVGHLIGCGIDLNVPLCTTIMLHAVEARDANAAFTVYDMLREKDLQPNRYLFVALIRACKLMPEDGERLAAVIKTALQDGKLLKNPFIATEVLSALYKHHVKAKREDTYKLMVDSYNQLFSVEPIHFLAMSPMVSQPPTIMNASGPPLSIVIQAYLSHGKPSIREALQRYRVLRHLAKAGREPYAELFRTSHTCNAFVAWFAAQDAGLTWVVEVVRNMEKDAWESPASSAPVFGQPAPTWQDANSSINTPSVESTSDPFPPVSNLDRVTAPSVLDSAESSEHKSGMMTMDETFLAPVRHYGPACLPVPNAEHGDDLESDVVMPTLEELVEALEQKSPETGLFAEQLIPHTERGDANSSQPRPTGFAPPDPTTFSILHHVLCKHAGHTNIRLKQASCVLAHMRRQNYKVDSRSWLSMLYAYRRLHHFDAAFWCIDKMVETQCWDEAKGKDVRLQLELEQYRVNEGQGQHRRGGDEVAEHLDGGHAQVTASE